MTKPITCVRCHAMLGTTPLCLLCAVKRMEDAVRVACSVGRCHLGVSHTVRR